ncbi:MAG: tetratricopeptide repeat protein [Rivularia sp. (in: cyanobacteria)]
MQPDLGYPHHHLGMVLQEQGKLQQAKAYYDQALELTLFCHSSASLTTPYKYGQLFFNGYLICITNLKVCKLSRQFKKTL